MKKVIFLAILSITILQSSLAQYDVGGQGSVYINSGNLGVGLNNPLTALHVQKNTKTQLTVERVGKKWVSFVAGGLGAGFYYKDDGYITFSPQPDYNNLTADTDNTLIIYGSQHPTYPGQMSFGATQPGDNSKLTVGGRIRSQEVQVVQDVEAPDYVFAEEYDLRTLDQVEAFIKANKHLPEIPSAAEFCENGVMLGEMSFDLLKKVEELTLYVIEMNKKIERLESELETAKK